MKSKFLCLLSLSLFLNFAPAPATLKAADASPRVFRAGAAKSNISPWHGLSINGGFQEIKAAFIHDDLHARCLVLDDGQNRLAMVVVDSCMVPREIIEAAKRRVARQIGFNPTNILISATHTHSAPAATPVFGSDPDRRYQEFLALKMGDTIVQAVQNLVPAQIGWGAGTVSNQVFNRRWRMKPGTILTDPFGGTNDQVKMNPGIGNTNLIEPAGPIDPEVWFISVQTTNGKPIALLANYSLHYCGGVGPGHVSADYFGMFARKIEKLLDAEDQDPAFVAIMSNGTSGNINNVNFREGQPRQPIYGQMRLVADAVAEEVFQKQKSLRFHSWVPLQARQTEITLGVRLPTPEEVATARQVMSQAKGPQMQTAAEVYARETVLMADYRPRVPVVLQALGMGELRIAAIPCEVFVEIGLELKKRFAPAFTISLANGYNGYLPTADHHKLGGYETWRARSSYLEVEAADKILQALDPLLSEVRSK